MITNEWFLKNHPEWFNANDEDVREALRCATNAIKPALFCQDGRLTRCLRVRMKEFLRDYGVDMESYDRDYYRTKELHTDEFLMELGLLHLARYFILKHKKEYSVSLSAMEYDRFSVYADDELEALKKAKDVYISLSTDCGAWKLVEKMCN